jgi:hypothetical protein
MMTAFGIIGLALFAFAVVYDLGLAATAPNVMRRWDAA